MQLGSTDRDHAAVGGWVVRAAGLSRCCRTVVAPPAKSPHARPTGAYKAARAGLDDRVAKQRWDLNKPRAGPQAIDFAADAQQESARASRHAFARVHKCSSIRGLAVRVHWRTRLLAARFHSVREAQHGQRSQLFNQSVRVRPSHDLYSSAHACTHVRKRTSARPLRRAIKGFRRGAPPIPGASLYVRYLRETGRTSLQMTWCPFRRCDANPMPRCLGHRPLYVALAAFEGLLALDRERGRAVSITCVRACMHGIGRMYACMR